MSRIRSYHLGHGLSVVDTNVMDSRTNDYKRLAFIFPSREIVWTKGVILTKQEKAAIEVIARTDDRSVSIAQPEIKVFLERPKTLYLITGTDRSGKRFKITTETPQHYNIYKGTLWDITNGKRKKIKEYYN